ncbi:hypothetical protein FKM82_023179 [Ascaphus truei]
MLVVAHAQCNCTARGPQGDRACAVHARERLANRRRLLAGTTSPMSLRNAPHDTREPIGRKDFPRQGSRRLQGSTLGQSASGEARGRW